MNRDRGRVPACSLNGATLTIIDEARFWERVAFNVFKPCWEWQGMKDTKGNYGKFRVGNTRFSANRVAYALAYGYVPAEAYVLHACDNPSCVRPDHLSLGTPQDNADDRRQRDRHAIGSRHSRARLTEEQVKKIIAVKGQRTYKEVAAAFGVSTGCVNHIFSGRTWPHIQRQAK